MSILFSTIKCFGFIFNLICLILGIGAICVSSMGLESARPDTEEHTYFIVGIVLGSLVCMITFFGCYGVVCELLGVNIIYVFLISMLLVVQYLQMQAFQPNNFYHNAVQRLEHSWRLVKIQPFHMEAIEMNYHCCGLYNSRDYNYKGLNTPLSCYQHQETAVPANLYGRGCLLALEQSYKSAVHREFLFNWALIVVEGIVCFYSTILSVILYRQSQIRRFNLQPVRGAAIVQTRSNHITRTILFSN